MFLRFKFLLLSFAISACSTASLSPAADLEADIKPAIERKVRLKVTEPFNSGNMPLMIDGISELLNSGSPELIAGIDAFLEKENYAAMGELAANVWVEQIEQGNGNQLPKLSLKMAIEVLPGIQRRIELQLNEQLRHPLMKDPIQVPADFPEFENGLWDLHVFNKQLENVFNVAQFCEKLAKPFERKIRDMVQNDSKFNLDFRKLAQQIRDQHTKLAEHDAEVRYYRLENAASELASSTDFETRLRAAFALEYDALTLDEFFTANPNPMTPNLQGEQLRQSVEQLVKDGRQSGRDVTQKAALLNVGLHWWKRGRYGSGPMRWGLLKAPGAHLSAASQFPLYMPKKPVAVDPMNQSSIAKSPQYDRRHHYIWAVEYNEVTRSVRVQKDRNVDNLSETVKNPQFDAGDFY